MEKLGAHLNALSPLIDRYQRGDQTFADEALRWLDEAEKTMSNLRLPEGAEMSMLRGRILRSTDEISAQVNQPKSVLRKARNVAASQALDRAEEIMRARILEAENRLKFFEEKFSEALTHYMLSCRLPAKDPQAYDQWLSQIWSHMRSYEKTRPLILYMSASLSPSDRSIIMIRVLDRAVQKNINVQPRE
jgi:hypothetical protein